MKVYTYTTSQSLSSFSNFEHKSCLRHLCLVFNFSLLIHMTYLFYSAYTMHGKIAVSSRLANGAQFAKSFLVNACMCNEND